MGNLSVFCYGEIGIDNIIESLEDFDPADFTTIEGFAAFIADEFRKKTEDAGFPESVFALVDRKLNKVSRYLLSSEE